MAAQAKQVSATGDAFAAAGYLRSVVLTAGSDAATCTIKDASGGTTMLDLKAAANTTVGHTFHDGVFLASACHVTLSGTSPVATVEYEPAA